MIKKLSIPADDTLLSFLPSEQEAGLFMTCFVCAAAYALFPALNSSILCDFLHKACEKHCNNSILKCLVGYITSDLDNS